MVTSVKTSMLNQNRGISCTKNKRGHSNWFSFGKVTAVQDAELAFAKNNKIETFLDNIF